MEFVPFDHKVSDSNAVFFPSSIQPMCKRAAPLTKENASSMKKTGDKGQCSRFQIEHLYTTYNYELTLSKS